MTTAGNATQGLTSTQRRLITGIAVIAGATTMVSAAYNYILDPMLDAFNATESQASLLRQLPSIAALLVVFLAGVLGDRFGDRRVLYAGGALFTAGSLLVAVAPVFALAALGMVVQSIGTSITFVVALGLLSARISDPAGRASAFSVFAIISPVIYLLLPVIAGALVDNRTWRLVPLIWTLGGLVMIWACWRLLPPDEQIRGGGELVTPVIAGLVLAAGVQTINSASNAGATAPDTLIRLGLTVTGLVVLAILYARRPGRRCRWRHCGGEAC